MSLEISRMGLILVLSGAILFFLGLLQGILIPRLKNPRMALSAHLGGVQSGMALMLFGGLWSLVLLPSNIANLTAFAMIAGLYFIWTGISLAAVTGASKALPIAGKGYSAGPITEYGVLVCEALGVLSCILSCAAIVFGLTQNF